MTRTPFPSIDPVRPRPASRRGSGTSRSAPVAVVVLLLASCAPQPEADNTATLGADETTIALPKLLRAVDRSELRLSITLNGETRVLGPAGRGAGEVWRTAGWVVKPGTSIDLSLRWSENFGENGTSDPSVQPDVEGRLTLATFEQVLPAINSSGTRAISNAEYVIDAHDDDGDEVSNLIERCAGSDPYRRESVPDPAHRCLSDAPPPRAVAVDIARIDPGAGPVIDGFYDKGPSGTFEDSIWSEADFRDANGERLSINQLMIDQGDGPRVMEPWYRWLALHDGVELYIFVEGKPEFAEGTDDVKVLLYGDSTELRLDDTLNLFIDGNNSKGASYDGVDDWHILLALTDSGGSNSEMRRMAAGPYSAGVPDGLRFRTCITCETGQHTWEIAVPLASLGIDIDRPFGIELQIDEDNDGGDRDARFGWAHPARDGEDRDLTRLQPRYMGTGNLKQGTDPS